MAEQQRPAWRPSDFLMIGAVTLAAAAVLGGLVYLFEPVAGFVVAGVIAFGGSTLWTIGLVAKGVEVGTRSART